MEGSELKLFKKFLFLETSLCLFFLKFFVFPIFTSVEYSVVIFPEILINFLFYFCILWSASVRVVKLFWSIYCYIVAGVFFGWRFRTSLSQGVWNNETIYKMYFFYFIDVVRFWISISALILFNKFIPTKRSLSHRFGSVLAASLTHFNKGLSLHFRILTPLNHLAPSNKSMAAFGFKCILEKRTSNSFNSIIFHRSWDTCVSAYFGLWALWSGVISQSDLVPPLLYR